MGGEYLTEGHPQVKNVDFPLYNTGAFNECEKGGRLFPTKEAAEASLTKKTIPPSQRF